MAVETIYVSPTTPGFLNDAHFGPRKIMVPDPEWVRPTVEVEGEMLHDMDAEPPLIEVDNPDCRLPADAVALTAEQYAAYREAIARGKAIDFSKTPPVAQDRPQSYFDAIRVAEIDELLVEIDKQKTRAMTDAILTGDKSRLLTLESQAQTLRVERSSLTA